MQKTLPNMADPQRRMPGLPKNINTASVAIIIMFIYSAIKIKQKHTGYST
jgi:hypothetical protein